MTAARPQFSLLGPVSMSLDGEPIALGGQKRRALLAVLLLDANRVVSRDRLIDALWGEEPPDTARNTLQVYVSQLRKLLPEGVLETAPAGPAIWRSIMPLIAKACTTVSNHAASSAKVSEAHSNPGVPRVGAGSASGKNRRSIEPSTTSVAM